MFEFMSVALQRDILMNFCYYKLIRVMTNVWNCSLTGKQMEENGLEWCCPNCNKKKEEEGKERESDSRKPSRTVREKDVKKSIPKETAHKDKQKVSQKDPKELISAEEIVTPVQRQHAR